MLTHTPTGQKHGSTDARIRTAYRSFGGFYCSQAVVRSEWVEAGLNCCCDIFSVVCSQLHHQPKVRPARIELAFPAWQASVFPLHHERIKWDRADLNRDRPR